MAERRYEALIDEDALKARIQELGRQIRDDYGPDASICCIGVLKGSIIFLADLMRAIDGPVTCDFLGVSSYEGTESSGVVRITHDLRSSIEGKHVLIVEDIVDTGLTLAFLHKTLSVRNVASLKVVALLDKPARRTVDVPVDYIGFSIPDAFVIGYGLDLDELHRNLPYVGIYDPEV